MSVSSTEAECLSKISGQSDSMTQQILYTFTNLLVIFEAFAEIMLRAVMGLRMNVETVEKTRKKSNLAKIQVRAS